MEYHRQPIQHVITHRRRHDDLSRLRSLMNAGGNVNAIALQNPIIINDVIDVDADAKLQSEGISLA
jgi:hypothetical protein